MPLVRLKDKRWEAPDDPQGVLPQYWGGIKLNRTVINMVLKDTANDRRKCSPLPHHGAIGPISARSSTISDERRRKNKEMTKGVERTKFNKRRRRKGRKKDVQEV
ncbi:hypothetical protein TNCV_67431 [Trichonephila clavipes]|nr:hypothetical protein TNCV_67431 [Trichonephila clavipes]